MTIEANLDDVEGKFYVIYLRKLIKSGVLLDPGSRAAFPNGRGNLLGRSARSWCPICPWLHTFKISPWVTSNFGIEISGSQY